MEHLFCIELNHPVIGVYVATCENRSTWRDLLLAPGRARVQEARSAPNRLGGLMAAPFSNLVRSRLAIVDTNGTTSGRPARDAGHADRR